MYKQVWKTIFDITKPYRKYLLSTLILWSLAVITGVMKPILLQQIVDKVVAGEVFTKIIITFGIILFLESVLFRSFDYSMIWVQPKIFRDFYNRAFDTLMQHSYSFFTNTFAGSLVAKVKRFANAFESLHDNFIFQIYNAFFRITLIVIILFFNNATLAIIFLVWAIVYATVSIVLTKWQRPYDEAEAKQDTSTTAKLADIIGNVLTVKMFAKGKFEEKSFHKSTEHLRNNMFSAWSFSWRIWATQGILLAILEYMTLVVAFKGVQTGVITLGTLVLVQLYVNQTFGLVWNLGRGVQKISKALSDMKEMVDIMDQPPEIQDKEKAEASKIKKGKIKFQNVTFGYHKDRILKQFNLEIQAGEKVGLVGASGSGKSTLTKLLLRFVEVNEGLITIDGQDITKLKQDDLRTHITYVPQEPLLFHRSIQENISYAKKATKKSIEEAAKKAHAHEFITSLPKGYQTLVGERGIKLSGGERQRVAIARALLKEAPILVMDEATSSLDTVSENYIRDATEKLMENKTTIVIAHRLSTVKKMDRIIVLDKGKIIEEGKHEELLKKKGKYYELYQHQSL